MQDTQTSLFSMPCQRGIFGGMQAVQLSDRQAPRPETAARPQISPARHQALS
jgi:hypothetical protein